MSGGTGLQAVAAMADNRVIGRAGGLPWHLPGDFRWFKRKTMGGTLVMGRKTFESIGRPLPGRRCVVLTGDHTWHHEGVEVVHEPGEVSADRWPGDVFVIGGASVYAALLPKCTDVFLTRVRGVFDGDTFLPEFESEFNPPTVVLSDPEFDVLHFTRRLEL